MKVIHFTEGAAELFESSQVTLTKFIPLLQGTADTYVTCLHLLPGASLVELPTAQECALLIVSGSATLLNQEPRFSVDLYPGVGVVVEEGDGYVLQSPEGAIAIAVNAERLNVSKEAVSKPHRVMGQIWPGDTAAAPNNIHHIFK
jgi:hypothetical protein